MKEVSDQPITVIRAAAVMDALGVSLRPGAVAVRGSTILAVDEPDAMPLREARHVIDLREHLLLPAMVNAHAHLDLTELGSRPYGGDFSAWLKQVSEDRPTQPEAIAQAVRRGVALSREAGVAWLGDVSYGTAAIHARQDAAMAGVSYLELFGLGTRQAERIAQAEAQLKQVPFEVKVPGFERGVVVGLSPHAPYTAGRQIFDWASRMSENRAYRVCTHAAEWSQELRFLRDGSGPIAEHLKHFGYSDADIKTAATGLHPIDHLQPALARARWMLVHCNHVEDRHIELIRKYRASVAYCPIASDYFRFPEGGMHRYREMIEAGVNVCLGTDSILCQPASGNGDQPMGILSQMRHLFRRDQTDPQTLLTMSTANGLRALLLDERLASMTPGMFAQFAAVRINPDDTRDPLMQALLNDEPLHPVQGGSLPNWARQP